jgi:hypothetical protein
LYNVLAYNGGYNFEALMDENDAINMLINPYYAVNISPDLAGEHEPLVTS